MDIVCHSMGALVSRWYMEYQGGGTNVRQWIGIAPVDQGAALANYPGYFGILAWLAGTFVEDVRQDGAVTQMRTSSPTVTTLNSLSRSQNVIYRIITGYNAAGNDYAPSLSPEFRHPFLTRGQTVASIIDASGTLHPHAWTYFGDTLLAFEQSELPGIENIDCFANLGHNTLPHDSGVVARVVSYLLDPSTTSLNNAPSTAALLADAHVQTSMGNGGFLFKTGDRDTLTVPVDVGAGTMTAGLLYNGSQMALTLLSPSGAQMVSGVYPVTDSSNDLDSVYYTVDSPISGDWTAYIDGLSIPTNGESYYLQVSFSSAQELLVGATAVSQPVHTGQSVLLWANLRNGTNPITGASVFGEFVDPSGQTNNVVLYDDGSHGDQTAGDGIYSLSFSPSLVGMYNFSITAVTGLLQRVEFVMLEVQPIATRPILAATYAPPIVQADVDGAGWCVSFGRHYQPSKPYVVC